MSFNCSASCLPTKPNFDYSGCSLDDLISSGHIKAFVATRCDRTVTDITDNTEIEGYYTAGTMFTSPKLAVAAIPFPTLSEPISEAGGPEYNTKKTYPFTFTSFRVDTSSQSDSTSWDTFESDLGQWKIAPVTNDNVMLVEQEFASGSIPGFEMQGNVSSVYEGTNAMSYQGQLSFVYSRVIKRIKLTDAVATAMGL